MMPGMDGFAVCRTARLEGIDTPILFLTARNEGVDRVEGLRLGANDYLGKPFLMEELLLRLDRLMDQTPSESWTQIERATIGEGSADFLAFEATSYDGTVRKLSKREGMLLKLLIGKEGEVVSREDILQMVWATTCFLPRAPSTTSSWRSARPTNATPSPQALPFCPRCGVQIHPLTRLLRRSRKN